jgi:hypothetical protein
VELIISEPAWNVVEPSQKTSSLVYKTPYSVGRYDDFACREGQKIKMNC